MSTQAGFYFLPTEPPTQKSKYSIYIFHILTIPQQNVRYNLTIRIAREKPGFYGTGESWGKTKKNKKKSNIF